MIPLAVVPTTFATGKRPGAESTGKGVLGTSVCFRQACLGKTLNYY